MKKLFVLLFLLLTIPALQIQAKSGDIAGKYYSTDIVTTLNGAEIDAINIGGQTLISAESMYYYSFAVDWYAEKRELKILSVPHAINGIPPRVTKSNFPSGTPLGNYYETDIVTYLDNTPITAYNLGGRTYIHAEKMRDLGYEVIWNPVARTLAITSPDRITKAFEPYSFRLYYGEIGTTEEMCGSFSVTYKNEKIIGNGDAKMFNLTFFGHEDGLGLSLSISPTFQGYIQAEKLLAILDNLAYKGDGIVTPCDPAEKYEAINEILKVSINGQEYTKLEITISSASGKNAHHTYRISVKDAPLLTRKEIESLSISLGEPQGEPYEIVGVLSILDLVQPYIEKLTKHPNDFMHSYRVTDAYFAIFMRESSQLGAITDRLYIIDRATGDISEDILEEVRQIDGFNLDNLQPYGMKISAVETNLLFSCFIRRKTGEYTSSVMTGDFYVEMDTGKVHFISKNIW